MKLMARTQPVPVSRGYRYIDRRGESAGSPKWTVSAVASPNRLASAANTSDQKLSIPDLDIDFHRNVNAKGRRRMMNGGRWLFTNFPVITGMILEQSLFATENTFPRFDGEDKVWGEEAEEWLRNWESISMVEGWPYDGAAYREMLVMGAIRCGDIATVLTENTDGYPQRQMIPSHRIGNGREVEDVTEGDYAGYKLIDGVIVNQFRRAIAYRVYDERKLAYQDIPARSMFLSFLPRWPDQVRGYSELACAIFSMGDVAESREAELTGQKAASKIALMEWNDTGRPPRSTSGLIRTATDATAVDPVSVIQPTGEYKYFKANSGSKLEAFSYNRPGAQVLQFQDDIVRDAMAGCGWSHWLSNAPNKVGGAPMRVVVDKLNRFTYRRWQMVCMALKRSHGYAIRKAIDIGILPESEDWWRWTYQPPRALSADKKYDMQVDVEQVANRMTTWSKVCGKNGEYYEDVFEQWLDEVKLFQDMARDKGVDLNAVSVGKPAATSTTSHTDAEEKEPATEDSEEKPEESEE
jgi:capsid protein